MAETTNRRRWPTEDILRPMNLQLFAEGAGDGGSEGEGGAEGAGSADSGAGGDAGVGKKTKPRR